MNLPRLAVHRPITTTMVLVSVLVLGGIALVRLPLAYLPELDVPFVGIDIPYPNSNPSQIEREITKPVEEVLSTLSGITKLESESTADGAELRLEFTWGDDLDVVRMQVSEKMDQVAASLPAGVGDIRIFSFSTSDIPVIQGRISAEGVDLSQNYDLLEARVINPIRRVPGVARVDLNGVAPREINIDLVLDRIKEHSVDVGDLVRRLQGAGANTVLGQIDSQGLRYTARSLGSFESLEAIGELVINRQGLRLADVAEITYEEPLIPYGRHLNRKYAIALDVYKESTANTVEVVRAVHRVVHEEIGRDPLLQGISLFVWDDQADQITSGIDGLKKAGLIGALLAVLSLYFFLRRLDSTFIVSLSIPFSLIATCGVLYFAGKSLNILSMMGLMLAVGMLVDNAIVVLEAIDRRLRDEPDREKAALEGTRHVTMAVAASTATTLIVFLPLVVGASTDLTTWLREVGITISLALACSLFSSLTLIPLVSAHLLRTREAKPNRPVVWLEERYCRVLAWTLSHRGKTFGLLVVGLVAGFLPFPLKLVKTAIFAAVVNERLYLDYELDDFRYKSEVEEAVSEVEEFLFENKEQFWIDSVYSYYAESEAGTALVLSRSDLSDEDARQLRSDLRERLPTIPGVRLVFREEADLGGSSTYFKVKFFGQDSGVLYGLAEEAARRLETVEGVDDITTPRSSGRREIQVSIDRDKVAGLGLTAQDISDIFSFTLGGMRLPRFNAGEREVETWVALRLEDRAELEDLKQIQLPTRAGAPVLLGDLARFDVVERPTSIERENRKVTVAVDAVYEGDDWDGAKKRIEGLMNAFELPGGYSWGWNDRIIEQQGQSKEMGVNFLLALILVYLVMAALFESLAQPFAILFSIPFALPGAAWLLAATGTPFNLMAQIGLLILMGIVVNNGIVLLDHMNQLRRRGLSKHEAVIQAGRDRLRPILMTAATTIIGLAPLAVGSVNVSGLLYYPMARTVMGGLMSSVVLTLVVLPYLSLAFEGLADWAKGLWRRSAPSPASRPEPVGSPGS